MSAQVTCLDFRRACQTHPAQLTVAQRAHRDECVACARFAAEQRQFEHRLLAALKVGAPEGLTAKVVFERSLRGRRRLRAFALAAALLLTLGAVLGVYVSRAPVMPTQAFVAHLQVDPLHTLPDDPNAKAQLARIAGALALDWQGGVGDVVNAKPCVVDGHQGIHLLIEKNGMRMNVFVMPALAVTTVGRVHSGDMPGLVLQTSKGVIAVFSPEQQMLAGFGERVRRAVSWT